MRRLQKALALIVGGCLVFQQMALADQQLVLPGPDVIPPKITYSPLTQAKPGEPARIEATVTDNVGVAEVDLFYRSAGDSGYRRVRMAHKDNSHIYWAVVPNNAGPQVEYYIEASDEAGNRVLRGRSFDPLTLAIPASAVAGVPELGTGPKATGTEHKKGGISKWVWIGLGMLAAGAVGAVALGGGGGNSNSTGTGTGTVTVTAPAP